MSRQSITDRKANAIPTRHRLAVPATQEGVIEQIASLVASSDVAAHVAEADPHTGYQKESEKDQNDGYAGLDSSGLVPEARIDALVARVADLVAAATTAVAGKVKVDNDSAGDPVALTSAGHGAAGDPHSQYRLESADIDVADLAAAVTNRMADTGDASEVAFGTRQVKAVTVFVTGNATPLILFFPTSGATKIGQFQQVGDVWSLAAFGGSAFLSINLSTGAITLGGKTTTPTPVAGAAPFNIPHGVAPTAPVDGDMWTTTAGLFVRINGATVGPLS